MANLPIASLPDVAKARDLIKEDDLSTWEQVWQARITPWDGGDIQPPLQHLIESREIDFPHNGRVLVPGCGSGYDAVYLASALESDTLGLDAAPTAVQKAKDTLASRIRSPAPQVEFRVGDFFALKVAEHQQFDVVYDYTFFVAIPVSRREDWARQMAALIKLGGFLITLIFPMDPPIDVGPPWFVRPEHYEQVLGGQFIKVLDQVPGTSSPSHAGRERIAVWKRVA